MSKIPLHARSTGSRKDSQDESVCELPRPPCEVTNLKPNKWRKLAEFNCVCLLCSLFFARKVSLLSFSSVNLKESSRLNINKALLLCISRRAKTLKNLKSYLILLREICCAWISPTLDRGQFFPLKKKKFSKLNFYELHFARFFRKSHLHLMLLEREFQFTLREYSVFETSFTEKKTRKPICLVWNFYAVTSTFFYFTKRFEMNLI